MSTPVQRSIPAWVADGGDPVGIGAVRLAPGRGGALAREGGAVLEHGPVERERSGDAHRVALPAADGPAPAQRVADLGGLDGFEVLGEQARDVDGVRRLGDEDQAADIVDAYAKGAAVKALARQYDVAPKTIRRVLDAAGARDIIEVLEEFDGAAGDTETPKQAPDRARPVGPASCHRPRRRRHLPWCSPRSCRAGTPGPRRAS